MNKETWGNVCNRVDTCALTGAAAFAAGVPGSQLLANGPLWCYFYALRYLEHVDYHIAQRFHGSQPDNNAVVYGSERYVAEAVERLRSIGSKPSVLFIESSCSLSLIGDDLNGIANKLQLPFPVITMDCGGMLGGFAAGYTKACRSFLERFADAVGCSQSMTVNVLGLTDFYYNGRADGEEICRLLEKAGYRLNLLPGFGSPVEAYKNAGNASLNIIINEELGLETAKYLQQRYGTPYLCAGVPYGVAGTMEWLKAIAEVLPGADLNGLQQEAEAMQEYLVSASSDMSINYGNLWFEKALISAPGTCAQCLGKTLVREWADVGELVVVCQQPTKDVYYRMADKLFTAGQNDIQIEQQLGSAQGMLLMASGSEVSVLLRKGQRGFASVNVAYPVSDELLLTNVPFVGIKGSAHMLQRLWNAYMNKAVRNR